MADSDTLRRLWRYKSDLEEGPDEDKLIEILKKLYKLRVSISNLQETGIGKAVNSYRRQDGIVGEWVKKVVLTWKTLVQKEVQKEEDVKHREPSPDCEDSDDSANSWASWDKQGERKTSIKQEKHDRGYPSHSDKRSGDGDKTHRHREKHREENHKIRKERDTRDEEERKHRKSKNHDDGDDASVRKEMKKRDEEARRREKYKDVHVKKEKEDRAEKSSRRDKDLRVKNAKDVDFDNRNNNTNNDDLTDSDAEPEQEVSNFNSIEQYYNSMLGQADSSKSRGGEKSERSKPRPDSGSKTDGKYSSSSTSECKKDGSSKSRSGIDKEKAPAVKRKHDDLKHAKVDRRKKNHSVSESGSEEESSHSLSRNSEDGSNSHRDDEKHKHSSQRSASNHSDNPSSSRKRPDHGSSQKVSSSTSSSHHKPSLFSTSSSKSSKPSNSHSSSHHSKSSSSKLSHPNSSSSSSHSHSQSSSHNKTGSPPSLPSSSSSSSLIKPSDNSKLPSSSSSSSHHSKSSSSSSHHSKSSSSSSHRSKPSSSSSHRSKPSSSTSSNPKPSTHSSSSKIETVDKGADNESIPLYIPTRVKIKTEKEDSDKQNGALYYTPTPISNQSHYQDDVNSDASIEEYTPSRVKEEKESADSSEIEDAYTPTTKATRSSNPDTGSENETETFGHESSYVPSKKIKKEKSLTSSEDSGSGSDNDGYIPTKKIKTETETQDAESGYRDDASNKNSSSKKYVSGGDGGDSSSGGVHKNMYLEALVKIQSEDGDDERYSPTHRWKVKEEKTKDDHRYGGGYNNLDGKSESDVDEAETSRVGSSEYKFKEKRELKGGNEDNKMDDRGDRHYSSKSGQRDRSSETAKDKKKSNEVSSSSGGGGRSASSKSDGSHDRGKQHRSRDSSSHSSKSAHSSGQSKSNSKHDEQKKHIGSNDRHSNGSHSKESDRDGQAAKHRQSSTDKSASKSSSSSSKGISQVSSCSPSESSPKTSDHRSKKKKKSKPQPEVDADFGLFSETIQIKKESVSTPEGHREEKKRHTTSVKSVPADVVTHSKSDDPTKHKKKTDTTHSSSSRSEKDVDNKHNKPQSASKSSPSPSTSKAAPDKEMDLQNVKKKKRETVELDDAGMSFDDFLNFDEAAVLKKSTPKTSGTKPLSSKKPKTSSSLNETCHSGPSVPRPSSDLVVTESDIMDLLPATQAYYRPIRKNPLYDQDEDQPQVFEFDPDTIGNRTNARSKLYSGKKHVIKELKSLHDLCLHVLMDNIDAIDHVGPIPYFILKPVLERCNAQQLYRLEDYNPHFIEDSEELWEKHCKREFRGSKQEEMETWRELFLRRFEEREAKYQKLKANMSQTITKGQAGRPARLAFVDTAAKPPREVLRQQKRYGTGRLARPKPRRDEDRSGSVSVASSLKAYKPSVTVPVYNPMTEGQRSYRPTPPMLARALQMRKNMRR